MSDESDDDVDAEEAGTHLDSVPSGAGCTEIWEELSEQREANAGREADAEEEA